MLLPLRRDDVAIDLRAVLDAAQRLIAVGQREFFATVLLRYGDTGLDNLLENGFRHPWLDPVNDERGGPRRAERHPARSCA